MTTWKSGNLKSLEKMYRLVRTAVVEKQPIAGVYQGRRRLLCPHRLGRNKKGQFRVLCYQYGGESERGLELPGSPANWRCLALEKLSKVVLLQGAWRTAPNHSRPQTCVAEADVDAEDQPGSRKKEDRSWRTAKLWIPHRTPHI